MEKRIRSDGKRGLFHSFEGEYYKTVSLMKVKEGFDTD